VLGEVSGNHGLVDVPEFDAAVVGTRQDQALVVGDLALAHPVSVAQK